MKTTSLLQVIAAGCALFLASCASDLDTTRVTMSAPSNAKSSSLSGRVHDSINDYRRSIGKAPLQRHRGLDRMAHEHCVFMARNKGKFTLGSKNISHYGFEGRALQAQQSWGMQSMAENVAGGPIQGDIPSQLAGAWAKSNKHNYNLKQNWSASGLGVYVDDDGMVYATQIFATQGMSHMALTDRFRSF